MERDRTELHDLAGAEPNRVKAMAVQWDAYAARANVLPLGGWRGKATDTNWNREARFELKSGDRLARIDAPAIAGRGFTVTAKFDTKAARTGVIVAQGGLAIGYTLYLAEGKFHFLARSRAGTATASTSEVVTGAHTAVARVDASGTVTLQLDGQPPVPAPTRISIAAMPVDGLQVGADEGGAVGPYAAPNPFAGAIESVTIELEPK